MKKREGASLLNVMVFMLFAVMITAQVFFFAKWSADSVAEEREIMMYRLNLDSLIEIAKDNLKDKGSHIISHDTSLSTSKLNFSQFYEGTRSRYQVSKYVFKNVDIDLASWPSAYHVRIHDLHYAFASSFDRGNWTQDKYGSDSMDKKVFAAMMPLGDFARDESDDIISDDVGNPTYTTINNRFYLIRAWAQLPENYYGRKLMYQVLVSRDEHNHNNLDTLSFQEVWF